MMTSTSRVQKRAALKGTSFDVPESGCLNGSAARRIPRAVRPSYVDVGNPLIAAFRRWCRNRQMASHSDRKAYASPEPESIVAPYLFLFGPDSKGISGQTFDCQ